MRDYLELLTGGDVGGYVTADKSDAGDELTYEILSGNEAGIFVLDTVTHAVACDPAGTAACDSTAVALVGSRGASSCAYTCATISASTTSVSIAEARRHSSDSDSLSLIHI